MKFIESKDLKILKDIYFDRRYKEYKDPIYKSWINHKYTHSIEVAEISIEIIENDKAFLNLPEEIKKDFVLSALFHDYGRALEIDHISGNTIKMDHGIVSANEIMKHGYTSPYITIPTMVHNKIDDSFITTDDETLLQRYDYINIKDEEKELVQKLRKLFYSMSKEDQRIIKLGIDFVKDADKLSNLLNHTRMMNISGKNRVGKAYIHPKMIKELYEKKLTDTRNQTTLVEQAFVSLSWFFDIRLEHSKHLLKDNDVLTEIKKSTLARTLQNDIEAFKNVEEEIDRAILFVTKNAL